MRIAPELLEQIVEHAKRDAPNECCGLVGIRDGEAVVVHEGENLQASPFRFEMDPKTNLAALRFEDDGLAPGAIYHSHTRSDPYPSQTDIEFAKGWPGWEWLIVGLAGGGTVVRSYLIEDGVVREVGLE